MRKLNGKIDWVATSGWWTGAVLAVLWFLFFGRYLYELVFALTFGIGP